MSKLGKLIGRGRVAEVFEWGDSEAIKLFYEGRPLDLVEQEAMLGKHVHEAGIASPAIGEVIELDGRKGFVLEKITGKSMLTEISKKPWMIFKNAKALAESLASIHKQEVNKLPDQRKALINAIRSANGLSEEKKLKIISLLHELREENKLCHGDFHPDNVINTIEGVIIIDWATATKGNPLADLARTSLLLQIGEPPPGIPPLMRWVIKNGRTIFYNYFINNYFRIRPNGKEEFIRWQLPITAARLNDGIKEEQAQLISVIDNILKNYS